MTRPRVLVLGGGSSQIALLAECRRRGHLVVLADRDPKAPGREYCDEFEPASTFDSEAVLTAARRWRVDAVLTAGTDQPVLVTAKVTKELGLPSFLDVETALAVTNKRVMKERFRALGIPGAPSLLIGPEVDEGVLSRLQAPYVTKPVDSQGQRGVYRLPDEESIRRVASDVLSFSREGRFLVEEYYPSLEVTLSGWVVGGVARILTVTDRVTVEAPPHIGVCFAHRYPTHLESSLDEVTSLAHRIVEGFGITSGPIYFQFLIGRRGVIVNEISCRLGGAYEERFIPLVTGIDPIDLLIRGSLGESVHPTPGSSFDPRTAPKRVSVPLLFCRPGRIDTLSDLEPVRTLPGVVAAQWLQPTGTIIGPMANSTQRVGYLVVVAASLAEMNERVTAGLDALSIRDREGTELLLDAKPYACHPSGV